MNSFNNYLCFAIHFHKLKSTTAKIYKTASSIGFGKKSIYREVNLSQTTMLVVLFSNINGQLEKKNNYLWRKVMWRRID